MSRNKKRKKAELFTLHAQLTSLGDELRETKEENIFQRHVPPANTSVRTNLGILITSLINSQLTLRMLLTNTTESSY